MTWQTLHITLDVFKQFCGLNERKLTLSEHTQLESILEDVVYTCGASLEDLDLGNLVTIIRTSLSYETLRNFVPACMVMHARTL